MLVWGIYTLQRSGESIYVVPRGTLFLGWLCPSRLRRNVIRSSCGVRCRSWCPCSAYSIKDHAPASDSGRDILQPRLRDANRIWRDDCENLVSAVHGLLGNAFDVDQAASVSRLHWIRTRHVQVRDSRLANALYDFHFDFLFMRGFLREEKRRIPGPSDTPRAEDPFQWFSLLSSRLDEVDALQCRSSGFGDRELVRSRHNARSADGRIGRGCLERKTERGDRPTERSSHVTGKAIRARSELNGGIVSAPLGHRSCSLRSIGRGEYCGNRSLGSTNE